MTKLLSMSNLFGFRYLNLILIYIELVKYNHFLNEGYFDPK